MIGLLRIRQGGATELEESYRFRNWSVSSVSSPWEALESLRQCNWDAVWITIPLMNGLPELLLEEVQRLDRGIPVVFELPAPDLRTAVSLLKHGAFYVVDSETDPDSIRVPLEDALRLRRSRMSTQEEDEPWRRMLVGSSHAMRRIAETVRLVAQRRSTVLITGETGTGKEMVARALHIASGRGHLPMVAVNCTALPEHLLESELFGHVKGAFTGAVQTRIGRFEQAHRSTLFLDEIGDMPLDLQAKLLRVLQEREIQRLGSSETIRIDTRVIAATNLNLMERIREGKFREDLYYRLAVVPVSMPPLRERMGDMPLLVAHFLDKICALEDLERKEIQPEVLRRLTQYSWPGNVRELENRIEMAIALSGDRTTLYPADFDLPSNAHWRPASNHHVPSITVPEDGLDFEQTVGRIELTLLTQALERARGNKKVAADMLRLKRTTLSAKLKSLEAVAAG